MTPFVANRLGGVDDGAKPYRGAAAFKPASVEWGGDWVTFPDLPHYQIAVGGASIAEIRESFEKGQAFVTT